MPVGGKSFARPTDRAALYDLGVRRVRDFCAANELPAPGVTVVPDRIFFVNSCAYYRADTPRNAEHRLPGHGPGINICIERCQHPCTDYQSRNWSWPGSKVDRTPFGVLCHELGHHCDWLTGERKGRYFSDYCETVKARSGEPGLTTYADENQAEWFAEAFRLFVSNPGLLRELRPKTYTELRLQFVPVGTLDWVAGLGSNVPDRVVSTLTKQGAKPCLSR